jgi:hypothetical protein
VVVENDRLSDKFMQSLLAKKNLLMYTKACYDGIEFFYENKVNSSSKMTNNQGLRSKTTMHRSLVK